MSKDIIPLHWSYLTRLDVRYFHKLVVATSYCEVPFLKCFSIPKDVMKNTYKTVRSIFSHLCLWYNSQLRLTCLLKSYQESVRYTSVTLPLLTSLLSFCVPYYMRVPFIIPNFGRPKRKRGKTRILSRTFPYRNKIQWSFWLISVTRSLYQLSIGWLCCLINRPQQTTCVCRWVLSSLID